MFSGIDGCIECAANFETRAMPKLMARAREELRLMGELVEAVRWEDTSRQVHALAALDALASIAARPTEQGSATLDSNVKNDGRCEYPDCCYFVLNDEDKYCAKHDYLLFTRDANGVFICTSENPRPTNRHVIGETWFCPDFVEDREYERQTMYFCFGYRCVHCGRRWGSQYKLTPMTSSSATGE